MKTLIICLLLGLTTLTFTASRTTTLLDKSVGSWTTKQPSDGGLEIRKHNNKYFVGFYCDGIECEDEKSYDKQNGINWYVLTLYKDDIYKVKKPTNSYYINFSYVKYDKKKDKIYVLNKNLKESNAFDYNISRKK